MHLIPRYKNDHAIKFGAGGESTDEALAELEEKLKGT